MYILVIHNAIWAQATSQYANDQDLKILRYVGLMTFNLKAWFCPVRLLQWIQTHARMQRWTERKAFMQSMGDAVHRWVSVVQLTVGVLIEHSAASLLMLPRRLVFFFRSMLHDPRLALEHFETPIYQLPPSFHKTIFEASCRTQDVYQEKGLQRRGEARLRNGSNIIHNGTIRFLTSAVVYFGPFS